MDGLTRLRHNSAFREALGAEVARARRYRRELSLLLLDIDDFKAVNDQIGHLAGDSVLSAFGARLANIARVADIPCRIGGDEFAVILPESGSADALRLFERLQAAGAGDVSVIAGPATFSGGVASWQFNEDPEPFFARADEALLEAKAAGKDRVVTSSLPGRSGSSVVPAGTGTQT
jgi:diguanylate cyclase (GGDEF)-like protein